MGGEGSNWVDRCMIKISIEVELPSVPNYLRVQGEQTAIPIQRFSEKELREIGRQWTKALIAKSKCDEGTKEYRH